MSSAVADHNTDDDLDSQSESEYEGPRIITCARRKAPVKANVTTLGIPTVATAGTPSAPAPSSKRKFPVGSDDDEPAAPASNQ